MSKIVALAQDSTALNLALTGVRVEEVSDAAEAEKRCLELIDDEIDVLIIEEGLRAEFSHRTLERLSRHQGQPLVVNCPAFDTEDSDVDAYLSSVIKPAVGFEIRLA